MIIFNATALLFTLAGFAAFVAGTVVVGPGTGVFLMGATAAALDFTHRRKQSAESEHWLIAPTRGGHVFFVPLFAWGSLLAFIGLYAGLSGFGEGTSDYREDMLKADETRMSVAPPESDKIGSTVLALLKASVVPEAKPEGMEIFTRQQDDRILVLLKVPGLRKFDDKAKRSLSMDTVKLVEKLAPGKKVYLGIKGTIFYGTFSTPNREGVGSYARPEQLCEFYGPKPDPKAAAEKGAPNPK